MLKIKNTEKTSKIPAQDNTYYELQVKTSYYKQKNIAEIGQRCF